ncbi:BNR repeat domain protein [Enhygromyxa salina]|uniref:BNR repeat domain protein n=1 Tax=Enhygromyxa salina TaxID=215803 RepID=A0A0C1Z3I6_9BACT|nr:hypothetical protein [Enhygromyxa salina]KIG12154.1 BNR repeat domain protein [Enhygromyxa salina]
MSRVRVVVAAALMCGCTSPNPAFNDRQSAVDDESGDGPGDGDGDPSTGDGDPTTDTGDGDGDGDGDTTTTGDGDGDDTGSACQPELTDCDGLCVDLVSDPDNCGACGDTCGADQICMATDCVDVKYVFVTSTRSNGLLGGIAGATFICAEAAESANLPGEYAPWLSTADNYPDKYYSQVGPYVRTDLVVVAQSWADLVDGSIQAPIDRDESGAPMQPAPAEDCQLPYAVWTGTSNGGVYVEPNCTEWVNNGSQQEKHGVVGDAKGMSGWSAAQQCAQHCSAQLPIYCFQQ